MSDRKELIFDPYSVELPEDVVAKLESLCSPGKKKMHVWTKEHDAILLRYWKIKRKVDVAKVIGKTDKICRERYEYLMRKIDAGEEIKDVIE